MNNNELNIEFRRHFSGLYSKLSSEGCWTCPKDEWPLYVQQAIELGLVPAEAAQWPLLPPKDY